MGKIRIVKKITSLIVFNSSILTLFPLFLNSCSCSTSFKNKIEVIEVRLDLNNE
jgi:hypothetical protein